jgi:preprotein translocase subunit SecA
MMKTDLLPIPGIVLGAYPERRRAAARTGFATIAAASVLLSPSKTIRRYEQFIERVKSFDASFIAHDRTALARRLNETRAALAQEGMTDHRVAEAFALIKRVCVCELGIEMFHTQLMAARIMLDKRLAEMATGEGKTLAAGLCAATAALAGIPVHVVTANDYLVARDAEWLRPLYRALGLTVGYVTKSADHESRRCTYGCNIVYCTASELVFDYLRDGLVQSRSRTDLQRRVATLGSASASAPGALLHGLCMAIVDEADSVLIDEARVPLILSERCANDAERAYFVSALKLAAQLRVDHDFVLHRRNMSAELTEAGRAALERLTKGLDGTWHNRLHREESVGTALAALHLYQRDRHYLVREARVIIIDQSTGRLAPGRVWSRGLHQLIELKEHCKTSGETVTIAQITYQRFFQRYLDLCGMSGTLREARRELLSTYGLDVVRVPLNRTDRRKLLPTRLYPDRIAQWRAVVEQVVKISATGRPVLIGTDSVGESEELSRHLAHAALPHAVLNARQDSDEARVIASAGELGRVTVATNMAGRGTDVRLGRGVADRGGLHVICCQHNASRRIDRQLIGRCARQGDPGSAQTLLSVDKPLITRFVPRWMTRRVDKNGFECPQWLVRSMVRVPQWLEERRQRAQRRELLREDARAEQRLSFGKAME